MTAKGKPAVATADSLERFRMTAENVEGSNAALPAKQVRNFRSPSMARIERASGRKAFGALVECYATAPEALQGKLVALDSDVKIPVLPIVDWSDASKLPRATAHSRSKAPRGGNH